ncbi:MAG: hypothetical protein PVG63_05715 [Anaerolineales bacterium]
MKQYPRLFMLSRRLIGCLILLFAACTVSDTTSTPTANAAITATPTETVVPGGGAADPTPEFGPITLCPQLELEIEFQQQQSMQLAGVSLENTIQASGTIPLEVDVNANPPRVTGAGELAISGGGHSGDCSFERSGTLTYEFEGRIIMGDDGAPQLYLGGQRSMNVISSPLCGGMADTPLEAMQEQALRYEQGAKVEWNWSVAAVGVQGSSQWVLHILCQE